MHSFSKLASVGLWLSALPWQTRPVWADDRPNFVVILTDDQDSHMDSIDHMEQVKKHLVDEGTSFEKHYCTSMTKILAVSHDTPR